MNTTIGIFRRLYAHTPKTVCVISYMEIPRPGLKDEKSEPVIDPEAVKVTFGAISRIKQAEITPLLLTLALTMPTGAL